MTICVVRNGMLAADTWAGRGDSGAASTIKIHRLTDVTVVRGEQTLQVKWMAFSGIRNACLTFTEMLNRGPETLNRVSDALLLVREFSPNLFSALFLLEDGSSVHMGNNHTLKFLPKEHFGVIGSGVNLFKADPKEDPKDILTSAEHAFIAARLMEGCGGTVQYVTLEDDHIRTFIPSKERMKRMQSYIAKQLARLD